MPALTVANTMQYWMPAVVALAVYRRVRRNFGVQPWRPTIAWIRLAFLALAACALLIATAFLPIDATPTAIGAALGGGLAFFGLKHTHVAWIDGRRTYTPNPWIGSVLSVLLVSRLAWRATHGGIAAAQQSPSGLTFGIAMVLIVYSLAYIIGLMVQMRRLPPQEAAQP